MTHPPPEFFDLTDDEVRKYMFRHDCDSQGCWGRRHRWKLELLKKAFDKKSGGHIMPSDVDGTVEYKGYFLFLEFKGSRDLFEPRDGKKMTAGDRYHFAITSQRRIVHETTMTLSNLTTTTFYVSGIAPDQPDGLRIIHDGRFVGPWEDISMYGLQCARWEWMQQVEVWSEDDKERARLAQAARQTITPWRRSTPEN